MGYRTTPAERRARIVAVVEDLISREGSDEGELALAEVIGETAKDPNDGTLSARAAFALSDLGRALYPDAPRFERDQRLVLWGDELPFLCTVAERFLGIDGGWEYLLKDADNDKDFGVFTEAEIATAASLR